jgi:cell division protein FtsZ
METKVNTSRTVLPVEPRIAVVGIGGAGCNVINDIYWADGSIYTIAINTDKNSLRRTMSDKKVCLCRDVIEGEGAKGDVSLGERCAKAHIDEIREVLTGHDAVFVIAGMGGGTGTGVAPVVATVARTLGMITFMIAIKPFSFETGNMKVAKAGISKVSAICPMTVVVENDKIATSAPNATMDEAFNMVNNSVVRFIDEKKKQISEAMCDHLMSLATMIEDRGETHSLSAYAGSVA